MKTIEVTDEMYDRLIEISKEINTQDNRATAKPYFFQVQQDKKIWDSGTNREHRIYIDFNSDPFEFEGTVEGVRNLLECYGMDEPEGLNEMSKDDIHEWVIGHPEFDVRECSYDIGQEYSNAFLTEKACKEHIEKNHYHYSNPVDFLQHAFRNPELELIFEFLVELTDKEKLVTTD